MNNRIDKSIAGSLIKRYPEVSFDLDSNPVEVLIPLEYSITRLADLLLELPSLGYDGLASDPRTSLVNNILCVRLEFD